MIRHLILPLCGIAVLAGCAEEPPPRSVGEFLDNPLLLEAAMVRCSQDRAKTRYEPECINARQAVARIQAKEEAEARAALEARSESKRAALRRTQAAAAEARRRAAEARRQREEAEYLAQFGVLPPGDGAGTDPLAGDNAPIAVVPDPESTEAPTPDIEYDYVDSPATAVGEAPADAPVEAPVEEPGAEPQATDLEAIRDELRRRNDEGG